MSGFSEAIMRERLMKLSNTTHSIQTLSMWILHHQKKNADAILDTWLKEVRNITDNERLLSLMNLANDVIQNARKKAPSFMNAFYEVLQPAIVHISKNVDQYHRQLLERILSVWRERAIYSNESLDVLVNCLQETSISTPNLISDPESPIRTDSPLLPSHSPSMTLDNSKKIKEEFHAFSSLSTNMINLLRRLEDPASADVKIRQIIAAYPEAIANPLLLKELKSSDEVAALMAKTVEAVPVVDAYCTRLQDELKERQNLQYLMADYIKALESANERNKALLDSVKKGISRLDGEKKELAKHIDSLPDLSQIVLNTTLPPLGELFTSS
ncbi:CID domain-containing protein [Meloidogyne graminicola]|uniref:CID domain-containing protein n=1 Tax=Meloidogyne graminicola TaxID=189291 RepID=A0A8T0A1G5_9BILA|nr:CID domain-containing protein [Meloidogyne graminicola]